LIGNGVNISKILEDNNAMTYSNANQ